MLLNECETIRLDNQHIYLAGIDDAHFYRADNIEKAASEIPPDGFSICFRILRKSVAKPRKRSLRWSCRDGSRRGPRQKYCWLVLGVLAAAGGQLRQAARAIAVKD